MAPREMRGSGKLSQGPWSVLFAVCVLLSFFSVGTARAETEIFGTPGATTWTVPVGVTSVTVEAWGGGGAGGGATGSIAQGGGGAGGQYAKRTLTVTPGASYAVVVGAGGVAGSANGGSGGDSIFASTVVVARGGAGGTGANSNFSGRAGGAGSAAGGVGDTVFAGGSGSSGDYAGWWSYYCTGGAGGGGAGSLGAGGSASGTTAGVGRATGGGDGGAGVSSSSAGNPGSIAGGGGSGGCALGSTDRAGGAGAAGMVWLSYTPQPRVTSIVRASTNPTSPYASVEWTVVFSVAVTGVDSSDFSLAQSGGATGASITSVSGSGTTWTVNASTGTSSSGTLGLNLVDDDTIVGSSSGIRLGGIGTGNGNFTGEVYTLQPPGPVLSKTASTSSAAVGDVITFTVTASNPLSVGLTNVVVTDTLPTGMAYSTSVAATGSAVDSGQAVTWTIPSLAAGASTTLTLAVSLDGKAKGTLTNTVTAMNATAASASVLVLASAITHFKMDELAGSWSGAAGEVIDSGGNGLHGKRLVTSSPTSTNATVPSPTIASQHGSVVGGFCNAGRFDGKAVVQAADSSFFDYTTQLSASAWIYPTGIQSELTSILSNDVNYEFHLNTSQKLYWWWNSSTLTSATTIPLNQWTHVAITFSSAAGAGRQKIYINGVADSNTNNWTGKLSANACPFYIGGDISTGPGCSLLPGRNFLGMIDEVKLYDYELSADEVKADMNLGRLCSGAFDHIRIEHDGVASICAPETVTVKACLNASCSTLYTGNVTVNLSPTGWVGGDTFTFSGGVASRQLSHNTAGDVTLGTVNVSPAAANPARCFTGSGETCTMNFANASCAFDAVETSANPQTRIFTKIAGVPFALDVLALSSTTTINTGFTGTVAVDLVDASVSACPTGVGLNAATNIIYETSNQGRKPVTFSYPSAARNVRVRAKVGSSTPACSSDSFAIRPSSFSSVTASANADASGGSASAAPAVKAGSAFTLVANTGVAGYDGKPKADPALIEWPDVPVGGRSTPGTGTLDGSTPGDLTFATAAVAASGNGASGSFTYDETGYFRFKSNGVYDDTFVADSGDKANGDCVVGSFSNVLSGGRYGCNIGHAAVTDHFGRFIPDHFDTAVTQGCATGAFTYSGQPFPLSVTARGLAGSTTQNYTGAFARAVTLNARNAADTADNPGPGAFASVAMPASGFAAGVGSFTPTYELTSKETAPTSVRLRAADGEVSSLRSPATLSVEGVAAIRGGRARLANAYGSELLDLPVSFRTEYYDGAGWVLNTLDSCSGDTSTDPANAVSLALSLSPATLATCVRDSGSPGSSGTGCAAPALAAKRYLEGATPSLGFAGNFNLWLQAPGSGQYGSVRITATVPAWLGSVPTAIATFGRYKSPLIYRRENY